MKILLFISNYHSNLNHSCKLKTETIIEYKRIYCVNINAKLMLFF